MVAEYKAVKLDNNFSTDYHHSMRTDTHHYLLPNDSVDEELETIPCLKSFNVSIENDNCYTSQHSALHEEQFDEDLTSIEDLISFNLSIENELERTDDDDCNEWDEHTYSSIEKKFNLLDAIEEIRSELLHTKYELDMALEERRELYTKLRTRDRRSKKGESE